MVALKCQSVSSWGWAPGIVFHQHLTYFLIPRAGPSSLSRHHPSHVTLLLLHVQELLTSRESWVFRLHLWLLRLLAVLLWVISLHPDLGVFVVHMFTRTPCFGKIEHLQRCSWQKTHSISKTSPILLISNSWRALPMIWEIVWRKQRERKWAPRMKSGFFVWLDLEWDWNHLGVDLLCWPLVNLLVPECHSGVTPQLFIFLCTNIVEELEFRVHYFLRKLIIIWTCDAFWQYTNSSFLWKIAIITQQFKCSYVILIHLFCQK